MDSEYDFPALAQPTDKGRRNQRLAGLACILFGAPLFGASYDFVNIASSGFLPGGPSINASGVVAFHGTLNGREGIYSGSGGSVTTVADGTGPYARFLSDFTTSPSIDDAGNVAFYALLKTGNEGVFFGSGGLVTTVFAGPFGTLSAFTASPSIANGRVAFVGRVGGVEGVYVGSGGPLLTIADTSGLFGGCCGIPSLYFPSINRNGAVAFNAWFRTGGNGIFTGSGGPLKTIVDFRTLNFANTGGGISINDAGVVSFGADPPETIALSDGGPLAVIADGAGNYAFFLAASSINNRGRVAFPAFLKSGPHGIFTGPDPVVDKVIQTGDALFGSTVTDLSFFNTRDFNDSGQIGFYYELADGRGGVARADPVSAVVPVGSIPGLFLLALLLAFSAAVLLGTPWTNRHGVLHRCTHFRGGQ